MFWADGSHDDGFSLAHAEHASKKMQAPMKLVCKKW
jgi:hypothetical protein